MPTYLTPGVYVEEVPSANKPIEGVGTSIAAFVGLAPGGPVNTPMRISNWTQFAKIFGDPIEPGQRAVHGGRLPRALRLRLLPERRQPVLDRARRRRRRRRRRAPRAALPAAADNGVEAFRARRARGRRRTTVTVEIVRGARRPGEGRRARPTSSWSRRAPSSEEYDGPDAQEGPHQHRHQGQRRLEADQDRGDRRVAARGAARPGDRHATRCRRRRRRRRDVKPTRLRGRRRPRKGMGGLAAVDEVTMVVHARRHDARRNGDDVAGPRPAGQDDRPLRERRRPDGDPRRAAGPAPAGDPRVADEHRRLRLEVRGALLPVDRGHGPADQPADDGPAVGPRRRRLVPHRRARAASTRRPANEVVLGANGLGFQVTHAEQGGLNKVGINCIRAFPGRGIRIWGARTLSSDPEWRYINVRRLFNYVAESIMEGTQWSVFEPNDERLWMQLRIAASNFLTRMWRDGRAVRRDARAGVLRQVRRRDQPARGDRGRAGRLRDRHRAGEAGRVRDLPPQPVHRRRRRGLGVSPRQRLREETTRCRCQGSRVRHHTSGSTLGGKEAVGVLPRGLGLRLGDRGHRAQVGRRERPPDHAQGRRATLKWSNITLKRGVDESHDAVEVAHRSIDGGPDSARMDGTIELLDYDGHARSRRTSSCRAGRSSTRASTPQRRRATRSPSRSIHDLPRGLRGRVADGRRDGDEDGVSRSRCRAGYVDARGAVHREGTMRLATARDEIEPLRDAEVRQNEAYLAVLLLARVGHADRRRSRRSRPRWSRACTRRTSTTSSASTSGSTPTARRWGRSPARVCSQPFEVDLTEIEDGRLGE